MRTGASGSGSTVDEFGRDMVARGSRLRLVHLRSTDFDDLHAVGSDPRLVPYVSWAPNSEEDTQLFLESALAPGPGMHVYGVVLAATMIGSAHVDIDDSTHSGEIGYVLGPDHWGHGYGSEVATLLVRVGFTQLGLTRVWATCDPDNVRSARVLENAGLRFEGILADHLEFRGQRRDSLMFGIGGDLDKLDQR